MSDVGSQTSGLHPLASGLAEEIARTRYGFEALRVRLGTATQPMPVSSARAVGQKIDRIKCGRGWVWTEQAVQRYEAALTRKAA